MSCSVVVYHVVFCRAAACYIMWYYVISCYVVLCYGPYAQTFYMCLESLVGCMKENCGSFYICSADGTTVRSFAKYLWTDGILKEC